MIEFKQTGDFSKTTRYFKSLTGYMRVSELKRFGDEGVAALKEATPIDSSNTANSWNYVIEQNKNRITISFTNSNVQDGVPIAVILQYGHGTRNGGWVEGRDYINPVIQPVFDRIANNAWKEVCNT